MAPGEGTSSPDSIPVCPRTGSAGEEVSYKATVSLLDIFLCSQVQRYLTV